MSDYPSTHCKLPKTDRDCRPPSDKKVRMPWVRPPHRLLSSPSISSRNTSFWGSLHMKLKWENPGLWLGKTPQATVV